MKRTFLRIWSLLVLFLTFTGSKAEVDVLDLLPNISEDGSWTWAEEPTQYTPESLFEYLNGAAPQYLSYGFVNLVHARYAYKGQDLSSVTLDIFDMGSTLGAYGIYSSGRPRGIPKRGWGTEGYQSGTIAAAWRGRIYLHGSADEDTPVLMAKLNLLMEQAASALGGEATWPPELSMLPEKRLITGSDRFIGKNLLGHSFLPGGFLANYRMNGGEGLLFLSDLGTPEGARKALASFHSYEEEKGNIAGPTEMGEAGFWAEDPGLGFGAVIRRKIHLAGLWGVKSRDVAAEILVELDHKLITNVLTD